MTEKTEDQIVREKEAVTKMIGAKSAMEAAISRIQTLENALQKACDDGSRLADFLGDQLYGYREETCLKRQYKEKFSKYRSILP